MHESQTIEVVLGNKIPEARYDFQFFFSISAFFEDPMRVGSPPTTWAAKQCCLGYLYLSYYYYVKLFC